MPTLGLREMEAFDLEAEAVNTVEEFKAWTRRKIRPLFPHDALASGFGHVHAGGVALDYVVAIDFPPGHLHGIRNRAGGIDTPILRRWLATREPQLFEMEAPWPDAPKEWLDCFRANDMRNAAAHAVLDAGGCVGSYHTFHRIPGRLGSSHAEMLKRLVPVMHEALCRAIRNLAFQDQFGARLRALSAREGQVARWVGQGRTNGDIAGLSGLSENTVKHHLTSIFAKLEVETRAQLIHRLTEYETKIAPGFGTKIM